VSLAARLVGVVRRPRCTFDAVLRRPRAADVLIVTTIAVAVAGAIVMRTEVGQLALLDQWDRTASAFGHRVDDAEYSTFERLSTQGPAYAAAMAVVNGPLAAFGAAVLLFAIGGAAGKGVSFRQIFAVTAHAGVILAIRQLIAAPAIYLRETTASATTLGFWFPGFDESSAVARFLGTVDLFVIWWAVVLGLGVAAIYHISARRAVAGVLGAYAAVAAVITLIMVVSGGQA
jgi:hypothetical protein